LPLPHGQDDSFVFFTLLFKMLSMQKLIPAFGCAIGILSIALFLSLLRGFCGILGVLAGMAHGLECIARLYLRRGL
jgi:hypothetical protein